MPARHAVRGVVRQARGVARDELADEVREEHLLTALLRRPGAVHLLGVAPQRWQDVLDEVTTARRRGGLSELDAAALAGLGIDLQVVVERVERELGPGALCGPGRRRRRLRSGPPLSAGSRLVLRAARRQGAGPSDRALLLGLLEHRGPVRDALVGVGVTVPAVHAAPDAGAARRRMRPPNTPPATAARRWAYAVVAAWGSSPWVRLWRRLRSRRAWVGGGPGPAGPGPAGVREPRRPRPSPASGSAAADLPGVPG